jgi:hypothetical protein
MAYAKFWVALIGGAATSAVAVFGANSTIGKVAIVLSAAVTAGAVYLVPNTPSVAPALVAPKE